jgi:hypothetical protein
LQTILTKKTRNSLANAIAGSGYSLSVPKYLGWGTGSGTAQPSDVALFSPVGSPISGTVSVVTSNTVGDTFFFTTSFTASGYIGITNVGLFDSNFSPVVGRLSNQVLPTDTTITVSGYNLFPNTFPFNVQILSEVMTVTSGNGTNVYNVIRAANGSSIVTTTIPSTTPVVGPTGNLFLKSSFSPIGLQAGDSIQFNVSIQFI